MNKAGFIEVEADSRKFHELLLAAKKILHSNPSNLEAATREKDAAQARHAQGKYISFLQQTAELDWLVCGDENSRLFHQSIKQRKRHDFILSIQDQQGISVHSREEIQEAFL